MARVCVVYLYYYMDLYPLNIYILIISYTLFMEFLLFSKILHPLDHSNSVKLPPSHSLITHKLSSDSLLIYSYSIIFLISTLFLELLSSHLPAAYIQKNDIYNTYIYPYIIILLKISLFNTNYLNLFF